MGVSDDLKIDHEKLKCAYIWSIVHVHLFLDRSYILISSFVICINVQDWGLLSKFPPILYFHNFTAMCNHTLGIEYHVYI